MEIEIGLRKTGDMSVGAEVMTLAMPNKLGELRMRSLLVR
jgi:hypothetical protein